MTSNPNARRPILRDECGQAARESQIVRQIKEAQRIECSWVSYELVWSRVRGMPNAVHELVVDYATGEAGDD